MLNERLRLESLLLFLGQVSISWFEEEQNDFEKYDTRDSDSSEYLGPRMHLMFVNLCCEAGGKRQKERLLLMKVFRC